MTAAVLLPTSQPSAVERRRLRELLMRNVQPLRDRGWLSKDGRILLLAIIAANPAAETSIPALAAALELDDRGRWRLTRLVTSLRDRKLIAGVRVYNPNRYSYRLTTTGRALLDKSHQLLLRATTREHS